MPYLDNDELNTVEKRDWEEFEWKVEKGMISTFYEKFLSIALVNWDNLLFNVRPWSVFFMKHVVIQEIKY